MGIVEHLQHMAKRQSDSEAVNKHFYKQESREERLARREREMQIEYAKSTNHPNTISHRGGKLPEPQPVPQAKPKVITKYIYNPSPVKVKIPAPVDPMSFADINDNIAYGSLRVNQGLADLDKKLRRLL